MVRAPLPVTRPVAELVDPPSLETPFRLSAVSLSVGIAPGAPRKSETVFNSRGTPLPEESAAMALPEESSRR